MLKALLLADQVYTDGATGKDIISGTFDCLRATEPFPTEFRAVTHAYISITDVHTKVRLALRYVDLNTNEVLMESDSILVESGDPLASIDFSLPVPPIPMPHEGIFAFELHADNELLGCLRITVVPTEEEQKEEDEDEEGFA